jgi:large conductance mechanosensitive channel
MAFILFCLLKAINKAMSIGKKKEEAKPAEDPADVKLLKELVAIVKEQNPEAAKAAEEKLAAK